MAERYDQVRAALDFSEFEIPRAQALSDADYPNYLAEQLNKYNAYYNQVLRPLIETEDGMPFGEGSEMNVPILHTPLHKTICTLSNGLIQTIEHYYNGRVIQAAETFKNVLDDIQAIYLLTAKSLPEGVTFYRSRTRHPGEQHFTREDLFHNPFENRGRVSTSRYSIPGLPALYLGDSVYVCWEETRQSRIDNLYFSRFQNMDTAKVVKIERIQDFLADIEAPRDGATRGKHLFFLVRYLTVFPLCIACSIKTRTDGDTFKPEYILPQLLLQYVTAAKGVAGIKFPSTRVDYSKIDGISAYNYVFPVKKSRSSGYCRELVKLFSLTAPTSLELERLMSYSDLKTSSPADVAEAFNSSKDLELVEGVRRSYFNSAFGYLELLLKYRHLDRLVMP
ncbi:RES domain-containing protein [Hymenobacter yonginensis]|uniref:RES domain-containing protein n=1 Tax=Hymenobacter yonginensis TaxID=748197 RepID=A0ABY7PVA1_9BACT|nr:RES domain-containing protein [Hymenobacter yonginensis]WBO86862.1 RES domain-containing protein [Hymenobacter yonginensis]